MQRSPASSRRHATITVWLRQRTGRTCSSERERSFTGATWVTPGVGREHVDAESPFREPTSPLDHAMAYDSARGRVCCSGQQRNVFQRYLGVGRQHLAQKTPATSPSTRDTVMAYDSSRERIVMLGGGNGGPCESDTWSGRHHVVERTPATSPRDAATSNAYDPRRARVVLFVVGTARRALSATRGSWMETPGSSRLQQRVGRSPQSAMAYDSARVMPCSSGGQISPAHSPTPGNTGRPRFATESTMTAMA